MLIFFSAVSNGGIGVVKVTQGPDYSAASPVVAGDMTVPVMIVEGVVLFTLSYSSGTVSSFLLI